MNRGVNRVTLIGNLGQDPEIRYMPNGNAVANLSLATSESWKDQGGQVQERTEWHKVVIYKKLAEIAGEYLKKGATVYLEGKNQTRKWQDQQGQDRYTTEVVCDQMQMLGGKPHSSDQSRSNNPSSGSNKRYQTPPHHGGSGNGFPVPDFDSNDDDIPL